MTKAAWQMGRPQQHGLSGGWARPPLVFLGPRDHPLPLQTGARMRRHTHRLQASAQPQLLHQGNEAPGGSHRPVTGRGFLPRSADAPCSRHSQDCEVFEDGLALDPLNTEEKEPQKYICILFKQLPH